MRRPLKLTKKVSKKVLSFRKKPGFVSKQDLRRMRLGYMEPLKRQHPNWSFLRLSREANLLVEHELTTMALFDPLLRIEGRPERKLPSQREVKAIQRFFGAARKRK